MAEMSESRPIEPDDEDEDEEEEDTNQGQRRKPHILESFMTRMEKASGGHGGSFKWMCNICSTPQKPCTFTGSGSKVMFHFSLQSGRMPRICQDISGGGCMYQSFSWWQ